jgi:hypothetical protein
MLHYYPSLIVFYEVDLQGQAPVHRPLRAVDRMRRTAELYINHRALHPRMSEWRTTAENGFGISDYHYRDLDSATAHTQDHNSYNRYPRPVTRYQRPA